MTQTRVIVADDHRILREGIRTLLLKHKDMAVVAEADNGRETVRLARELSPHVVIMDITMPGMNGMEATRQILAEQPEIKIIALSMHSDKRFVASMLNAGASGYLRKDCAADELIVAIGTVMRGEIHLSPKLIGVVAKDLAKVNSEGAEESDSVRLTSRENEVLQLLVEGKSTKQMAEILNISGKTIEKYRKSIMEKVNVRSLSELTKYAVREGITPLE
ncbi:MAG TPA: response regulator transcription factor [Bacteroidota bacterium]|nr:response regulator transcription factor [Bacteroidota bacterium]